MNIFKEEDPNPSSWLMNEERDAKFHLSSI